MGTGAVSLLMTTYGRAEYLPDTLDSILAAEGNLVEIVLVDDGSPDDALDVLKRYREKDARIKIISKANTGIVDSSNIGLKECTGDYIARLDSDDLMVPDRLKLQAKYLDNNLNVVAVGSALTDIDAEGNIITACRKITPKAELHWGVPKFKYIPHPGSMIRRKSLEAIGGYRAQFKYAEDADLWLRLLSFGEIHSLDVPLTKYRIHGEMASRKFAMEQSLANQLAILCWLIRKNNLNEAKIIALDRKEDQLDLAFQMLSEVMDISKLKAWSYIRLLQHAEKISDQKVKTLRRDLDKLMPYFSLHPGWIRLKKVAVKLLA